MIPKNTKIFSSYKGPPFAPLNLIEVQLNSWKWFKEKALKELFEEASPIKDHTGHELELHFLDYKFDPPKYTERQAQEKDQTYEASLRANLKLIDKQLKQTKVQEVYLGDFPIMTERGTFIINGVERVVISQLIRSAGIYFNANVSRGRKLFGAKIIPNRGSWIEIETDLDGVISVRIDRKRKTPVTQLFRIFGLEDEASILKAFENIDRGEIKFIETTLKKDEAKNTDDSFIEIYKRLRPGDLATPENAKTLIEPMFKRFDRYDLSRVGRFKFNQRLGLAKKENGLLDKDDIVAAVKEIIKLNNDLSAEPDNIDHLGNRRVRAVGELVQAKLRVGLARLRRGVQDRMSTFDRKSLQP
ncbi:MAG: DNA-directed RNA polymerase subunit beta, partial [Patescibacteria group bacterium]